MSSGLRRYVPVHCAATDLRSAPAWLRRGGGHQEQAVHGPGSQARARDRIADGAVEDLGRVDGSIRSRHARARGDQQRTGAGGQSPPGDRAREHLWAIWQGRVPGPSRLRRTGAGLWRHDEQYRRPRGPPPGQDIYRRFHHGADRMGRDHDGTVGGHQDRPARSSISRNTKRWRRRTATPCRSSPARALPRPYRQLGAGVPAVRHAQCADGWVFIGASRGDLRWVPAFRGSISNTATLRARRMRCANSEKGKNWIDGCGEYCATRTSPRSKRR